MNFYRRFIKAFLKKTELISFFIKENKTKKFLISSMNKKSRKDVYITENCLYNSIYLNVLWFKTINTDKN
jgi:hypothetical protein